jgi:hypothetical protein
MMQIIKTGLLSLAALFVLAMPAAMPIAVSAQTGDTGNAHIQGSTCYGAEKLQISPNGTVNCTNPSSTTRVNDLIRQIINILSVIVGIVAVIMIIIGGFRYITSGGAAEKITGAKNTILYALIGLIIVALAQIIVRFVLSKTVG